MKKYWSNDILKQAINEIVEKMKKGDFVLYSPLIGVEEIKPTDCYYQTYNCEPSLAIECKDFLKSNFTILEIYDSEIRLGSLNRDIDVEYQFLCLKFENGQEQWTQQYQTTCESSQGAEYHQPHPEINIDDDDIPF